MLGRFSENFKFEENLFHGINCKIKENRVIVDVSFLFNENNGFNCTIIETFGYFL